MMFRLQCFKSAWLYAFLHDGLRFPVNYQRLRSASLVNNNDVQWTLGAILYKTRFLPLRFVCITFESKIRSSIFSRAINQVKSTLHYRRQNSDATIMIILICIMFGICLLIFFPKILRMTRALFFYRRTGLRLSASSSNFNQRYPLLTSIVIDTSSSSDTYSNGKTSKPSTNSYNNWLRSV